MAHSVHAFAFDPDERCWLSFTSPREVVTTSSLHDVVETLRRIEELTSCGDVWGVGWVSYEASPAFDPALEVRDESTFPKVWFAIFDAPQKIEDLSDPLTSPGLAWTPSLSKKDYSAAIAEIRSKISEGDTYQTNFTFRLRSKAPRDPFSLFTSMVRAQGGDYSCFIDTGELCVLSASPELFFKKDKQSLICKPMKGTNQRGRTHSEDTNHAQALQRSEKNRAENIMIVDMTRNDLSKIAAPGSVHVSSLCSVERYPHMHQMTSEVRAQSDRSLVEIFQALFPAASITGAPKPETMGIIARLEGSPRNIYTGAIGVISPNQRAWFNVAIRTAVIDRQQQTTEYGVGSGIVWDSSCDLEYDECLAKAAAVWKQPPPRELFETILWEPDKGFFLKAEHLNRLARSAEYYSWSFNSALGDELLETLQDSLRHSGAPHRVKLLCDCRGSLRLEHAILTPLPRPYFVSLAGHHVASNTPSLFHKTTDRRIYNEAVPSVPGSDDVILWNERREITETRIANICVEIDGRLYTPPCESGVLAGCFRELLLRGGEVSEKVISIDELRHATRIILMNSLRRTWEATLLTE